MIVPKLVNEANKHHHHAKNVLIRDLTEEQSSRLLQLQKKFGVKTNSQALLLLLQYCVIADDEINNLIECYDTLAIETFAIMQECEKRGLEANAFEPTIKRAMAVSEKLNWLLSKRK